MKRFVVASLISVLAGSGVACSDHTAPDPVATVAVEPDSFPPADTHEISGVVFERTATGTTPLANVQIWLWVSLPKEGYSRYAATSDATGHYSVDKVPNATIYFETDLEGYDWPCSTTLILNGADATVNLEMVSKSHPLPELATTLPSVSGVVYEMTPNGKQPIAGAWIEYDIDGGMGVPEAHTTTDANGRYAICNLTPLFFGGLREPQEVAAGKTGYVWTWQELNVAGAMQVDFELKPQS